MNERPSGHAHKLVAETAEAMAHELYDTMMQDNQWYKLWRKSHPGMGKVALEELFVRKNFGKMIPQARATLTQMMQSYAAKGDQEMADKIYEALTLDATLIRGRTMH